VGLNLCATLLLTLVLVFCFGIVELLIAAGLLLLFFVIVYVLTLPLCTCAPKEFCCAVYRAYRNTAYESFSVQSEYDKRRIVNLKEKAKKTAEGGGSVELAVGSTSRTSSIVSETKPEGSSVFSPKIWCGDIRKYASDLSNLKKLSSICSVFSPLLLVMFIAYAQSMVSVFIIYYGTGGQVFMVWHYFPPAWQGLKEYGMWVVTLLKDPETMLEYIQYVASLSVSWESLFQFGLQFDRFKFTILLLRTIFYTVIGIVDSLSKP